MKGRRVLLIMALLGLAALAFVYSLASRPQPGTATPTESSNAKPVPPIDLEPVEWSTGKTAGAYVELRIADAGDHPDRIDFEHWRPDAHYLSDTAITLLTVPFTEAHPGFSEFMPMLLPPAELGVLVVKLKKWKDDWLAFATLADVHERWDRFCPYIVKVRSPSDWQRVRDTFVKTVNALIAYVSAAAARNESVWFLGY
jgi:hypothetical protein